MPSYTDYWSREQGTGGGYDDAWSRSLLEQSLRANPGLREQINQQNDQVANRQNKAKAAGPYRGGLTTDFNYGNDGERYMQDANDPDADVRQASALAWEQQHPDAGSSSNDLLSRLNVVKGRIATKNSLAQQIASADSMLQQEKDLLSGASGEALDTGLKNTRNSYNSRGLLYSGLRQSDEGKVRGQVGSQLASGIASATRESMNSKTAAQNAYAAVGLQNAQESLNLAKQAFDTASQNQIARLQAMQQLYGGIGQAAGYAMGSYSGGGSAPSSTGSSNGYSAPYSPGNQTRSPNIGY